MSHKAALSRQRHKHRTFVLTKNVPKRYCVTRAKVYARPALAENHGGLTKIPLRGPWRLTGSSAPPAMIR